MSFYNHIIENPLFFKWIFHPSSEIEAYWKHYLESNPKHAEKIIELKSQIEIYLKYEEKKLTETEKRALAKRIVRMLELTGRKQNRIRFIHATMRYAATAILFFLIGGSLVYLYMERRQPQIAVENISLPVSLQEPMLFLGDRKQIALNRGESQLEYSSDGKIVVNQENTIESDDKNTVPVMNTLVIPYGSRSRIALADGTKVWLNAGSRLIYPSRFVDATREVFLSGEAFFDVTENEKQPFVVKTADVLVEVLGTEFNVTAYPEDSNVLTVLASGEVKIKGALNADESREVTLKPGQLGNFDREGMETSVYEVNVDEYTLWTEGLFYFSNTDLNRITKKLERFYNVQFHFNDPFQSGMKVSGKLDVSKDRSEVFHYLERLTALQIVEVSEKRFVIK